MIIKNTEVTYDTHSMVYIVEHHMETATKRVTVKKKEQLEVAIKYAMGTIDRVEFNKALKNA